jgi:hypothetical protein
MKRDYSHRIEGIVGAAVISLVAGTASHAAEGPNAEVQALTQPRSSIELGVGNVGSPSFKFGEYNGLQKDGAFLLGNLELVGGGSYDSSDPTRWRIRLGDFGLSDRSLSAEFGQQGRFRFNVGYDELRHYAPTGDSYRTPYLGAGGNALTLPANWIVPIVPRLSGTAVNARGLSPAVTTANGIVAGVSTAPTAAQLTTAAALQAADLPAFQKYQLYTERKKYDAGFSVIVTPKWEFAASARREDRTGSKAMGSVTRQTGGDISTILPDPIDQTTDQFTATLGYKTRRNFITLGYYASVFNNHITSVSWQNWALPTSTATMSSAPSNKSQQFNLTAGQDLGSFTRIAATAALTRNTQDDAYYADASTVLVPVPSLKGQVNISSYALKLSSRPVKALSLGLGYKYEDRVNRTAVNSYGWYDAQEAPAATAINANFGAALNVPASVLALLTSNVNVNANRPYSRKLGELAADADYTFVPGQALHGSYTRESIDRWCEGSWISCVDAANTTENTFKVEWRSSFGDAVHGHLSYAKSSRKVDAYNENAFLALVPLANVSPTGATGGASAYSFMVANGWNGWGPAAGYLATTGNANLFFPLNNAMANAMYQNGNRISELPGMRRYNMADRKRDRMRADLDWQVFAKLSLTASGDYRKDDYNDSRYGLTADNDWSGNFEAVFTPGENLSLVAFLTHEVVRQKSAGNTYTANSAATSVNTFTAISGGCFATIALRNASNKLDPCLDWSNDMTGTTNVYGFSVNRKGLLPSHRLDLKLQATWTRGRNDIGVAGGNYANNPLAVAGAPAGTIAAYYIPATPLPVSYADVLEIRGSIGLALNSWSSLRLAALYADYKSSDWAYDGLQYGGLAGVLPTSQVAPHYGVGVITVSYGARF